MVKIFDRWDMRGIEVQIEPRFIISLGEDKKDFCLKTLYTHRSSVVVLLHGLPHSTPCFNVLEIFHLQWPLMHCSLPQD